MSSQESIHHVRKIKVHRGKLSDPKTIDIVVSFDATSWEDPTLVEKEFTFFLDRRGFDGFVYENEPSSLEDRKNAATVAIHDAIDHSGLLEYIAELYRRLETTDPTFSLDG